MRFCSAFFPPNLPGMAHRRHRRAYPQLLRASKGVSPTARYSFHPSLPSLMISAASKTQYFDGALPSSAMRADATAALPIVAWSWLLMLALRGAAAGVGSGVGMVLGAGVIGRCASGVGLAFGLPVG